MAKAQMFFKRTEKKYIVSQEQYESLVPVINEHMKPDEYGNYEICNIYFDTDNYDLIRNSIEKPLFKEKLRLRSYGTPDADSMTFLEIKRKFKGTVYKRRISLPYSQMMAYLNGIKPLTGDSQVLREIDYFMTFYKPSPKLYLAYNREAFKGVSDKGLRLTFDSKIRSRETNLELSDGDYGKLLLCDNSRVMEIKTESAMPLWLCDTLNNLKIYPTSFSKYGKIYENRLKYSGGYSQCLQA